VRHGPCEVVGVGIAVGRRLGETELARDVGVADGDPGTLVVTGELGAAEGEPALLAAPEDLPLRGVVDPDRNATPADLPSDPPIRDAVGDGDPVAERLELGRSVLAP
jgi:hypothetical protein